MAATTRFPRVRPWARGYAVGQVDAFLTRALGQRLTADAVRHLVAVREIAGQAWLTPDLFRFGASSLLDDLLRRRRALAG